MNILVVGCGRAGANLVRILEQLGHEVSVLDADPAELERLDGFEDYSFSGVACAGIPIDTDVLRHAGIETCDAVAIATNDDSVNIMVAQIAKEVFQVERVITRVTDPSLKDFFMKQYGLKAVCPTNLSVQSMLLGILEDEESRTLTVGSSTAAFFTVPVEGHDVGRLLSRLKAPRGEIVFGVLHASGAMQLAAQPSPVLEKGDRIVYARIAD